MDVLTREVHRQRRNTCSRAQVARRDTQRCIDAPGRAQTRAVTRAETCRDTQRRVEAPKRCAERRRGAETRRGADWRGQKYDDNRWVREE
eukprot:6369808-Alexandrium_andersonii.AAC.1